MKSCVYAAYLCAATIGVTDTMATPLMKYDTYNARPMEYKKKKIFKQANRTEQHKKKIMLT